MVTVFAAMISRLDLLIDFLQILEILDSFRLSILRRFGHEILGIISQEKMSEKTLEKAMRGKGSWDLLPLKRTESSTPFFLRSLQI